MYACLSSVVFSFVLKEFGFIAVIILKANNIGWARSWYSLRGKGREAWGGDRVEGVRLYSHEGLKE